MVSSNKHTEIKDRKRWIDLMNESVHTIDDADIGDIEAVSRAFIVVKRGFVNVHYYYIPIGKVEGWDGNVVWLKVPEEYIIRNYERDVQPDPSGYYVKDFPGYTAVYPEVEAILPKYSRPAYTTKNITLEKHREYLCELCQRKFDTEDALSQHVNVSH